MLKMEKVSNPAIVNVASIAALTTGMGGYAYGASKAACDYFNQSVAKDGFGRVLGINSVLPGELLKFKRTQCFLCLRYALLLHCAAHNPS